MRTRATASALPMLSACPNYESDNEGPKPHAEFGSLFHKAVEEENLPMLVSEEGQELARAAGKTRAQCELAYAWAINYQRELQEIYEPDAMQAEVRGQCDLLPGRNFYIDLLLVFENETKAVVVDWKSSRTLDNYQADSNEQGQLYVAAVFENAPKIQEVTVIFAAPFCEDEDFMVSEFIYDRTDEQWIRNYITETVEQADAEDSIPTACSYCTWCKHYKTCPETTAIVAPAMENRFGEVMERAKKSPILMGKLRDCVPVLTKVVDDIKRVSNDMHFEEGIMIPGYAPVQMRGKTSVKDPGSIIRHLAATYDLKIDDIADYIKIDLAGIETIVKNNTENGHRGKAVDEFREYCDRTGWTRTGDGCVYLKKSKKKELK